jgi:hypothetical protein
MFVNTTSDTVVAGACQAGVQNPGCSLRGAILKANEGPSADVISIGISASDPFCSAGVCTINLTQALPNITGPVAINGPGADKLTVRGSSGGSYRIFTVTATGTVTISGITISDGSTSSDGGGISNETGTLNVANSTISNNFAPIFGNGPGIFNNGGTLNVTNSTISNNSATVGDSGMNGGGILNGGTANVRSSIIALNTATTSAPDVIGSFASAGFNLIGKRDGSTGFTTATTDQTGTIASPLNPMLEPGGPRNNGGPTRTIALLVGSPAIDKGASNGLTGNLTTDQRGAGFQRTFDNLAIPNASSGNGTDIGAFERQSKARFDFDGDGKSDVGIFRPSVGEWWYLRSSNGQVPAFQFGAGTDKIVPADYTGDGKTDIAFYRPSTGEWYIIRSENLSYFSFPFGASEDIPVPADYDNDGKADPAVFRPSAGLWVIQRSSDNGTTFASFGTNGDVPVPADYDGDGRADIAIYRPSVNQWWLNRTTAGVIAFGFGVPGAKVVQGDYTGDGKSDVAFWQPSTGEWFVLRSENLSYYSVPFGITPDVPAPGDYDGDGKFDTTVFRPASGSWFIQRSTTGFVSVPFGTSGDRPLANAFIP